MTKRQWLIPLFLLFLAACKPAGAPTSPPPPATPPKSDNPAPSFTMPEVVPGPVRECIEEEIGPDNWGPISSGQRQPDSYEASLIEACLEAYHGEADAPPPPDDQPPPPPGDQPPPPPGEGSPSLPIMALDTTSPLPESPEGKFITAELGPVTLKTYSPVTLTFLENSTNIYIYATNNGNETVTVQGPRGWEVEIEVLKSGPPAPKHFFEFSPLPVEIAPGETVTFEFMTTRGEPEIETSFPFTLLESGQQAEIRIQIHSEEPQFGDLSAQLPYSAAIEGRVTTADGAPLEHAEVTAYALGNIDLGRGETDNEGRFYLTVPSSDDLRAVLGERPLPYTTVGYTLQINAKGYTPALVSGIEIPRGETATIEATVQPVEARDYTLIAELHTDGAYGYWWLLPLPGFETFAAVQGRHPPELNVPGHIIGFTLQGEELWRFPTANECWGFDVSIEGMIAAGCHDGSVYLLDSEGNLRWEFRSNGMNRWVRFSPDGRTLLTGPGQRGDVVMLDVESGQPLWESDPQLNLGWLRNAVWSPDGERVLTGHGGGVIVMFNRQGELLWRTSIGEFPMVLEMDEAYNSYMAGKSRELFSFDGEGNLRWRERITTHVVTAGANNMDAAGERIAMGTVSGQILAYDRQGDLLWQNQLGGELQGHNALDMTPNGEFILAGSAGERGNDGYLSLFNTDGGLVWREQYPDGRDLGTVPAPYEYDHNHRGAITVAISDDGRYLVAGFGDSTIRIFELAP